jgi:hypothetical protein
LKNAAQEPNTNKIYPIRSPVDSKVNLAQCLDYKLLSTFSTSFVPLFQISESRMMTSSNLEEIIGNIRHFDLTLKAENTLDSVLKTLDVDCYKPEAMENLLGVLSHVIQGTVFLHES